MTSDLVAVDGAFFAFAHCRRFVNEVTRDFERQRHFSVDAARVPTMLGLHSHTPIRALKSSARTKNTHASKSLAVQP